MESKRTKQCKVGKFIFGLLHFLCLVGPFLYFIPYGFIVGETVSKVALSFTIVLSLILGALSFIVDQTHRASMHRSIMWAMIIGVLFCLSEIKTFIWIMAIASILDELVFVKLRDHYKVKLIANREIDRRS